MDFWTALTTAVVGILGISLGAVLNGLFNHRVQERRLQSEHRVQEKRLQFEQENAVQQKLVDLQSALLDELGKVCWKFRYDAIRVVFYWDKSQSEALDAEASDAYDAAADRYKKNCWKSLNDLRYIGTRVSWLFSISDYQAVEKFYAKAEEIDTEIELAIAEKDQETKRSSFKKVHPKIDRELRDLIAELILNLAKRVSLTPSGNRLTGVSNPPGVPLPGEGILTVTFPR
jgi:hypothetical protein